MPGPGVAALSGAGAWWGSWPDQRTALTLLAAGYSYKEIAERKGWTYTKVNRCIREGRAALRCDVAYR